MHFFSHLINIKSRIVNPINSTTSSAEKLSKLSELKLTSPTFVAELLSWAWSVFFLHIFVRVVVRAGAVADCQAELPGLVGPESALTPVTAMSAKRRSLPD